ncbi:DUF1642 domain-containing protein [Enterococcus faecalis]|uniref:DUF1642 domain-containing protein n=6 Tax=Enterococcus faecalis TaxID=1351 RepID=UPI0001B1DE7E|nr:DUF1642 domain-containing protein [Enterococcus faecalis]EOL88951.1 hypothetical protein WM3_03081 [Enterococcus faecalis EnGen0366]EET96856.1 conserved hypothetical protein [Enterococcus faecalis T2]EOJ16629.1 hypothetical protein UMS_02571 [Enterococcus faecalis EnGen0287]EOJ50359.1 hypothetical protein WM9_01995 [Enterococcus faecalis EnGen0345]MDU2471576.1 DUF1642 domain-containing protein [Enterococcus faecalis]
MNKQELIGILEGLEGDSFIEKYNEGYDQAVRDCLIAAKQLDEPKKVIFSHEEKFVADWLNDLRGQISNVKLNSGAVFMTFIGRQLERYYDEEYSFLTEKIESWLTVPKNKVKLMSAIDNGYEVEKEQLYYVKFDILYLQKYLVKNVETDQFYLSNNEKVVGNYEQVRFTEQEIKSIDERYWTFAVKVEEAE